MSNFSDHGVAYAELRAEIDSLIAKLGGSAFAMPVVATEAREALQRCVAAYTTNWRVKSCMVFCEPLLATAKEIRSATAVLRQVFAIREEAPSAAAPFKGDRLVIRGDRLYFETDAAALLLVHCYADTLKEDRWTVATTKEAETFLELNGMDKPKVGTTFTKSAGAATAALHRIAKQYFKVDLVKTTAAAAKAPPITEAVL